MRPSGQVARLRGRDPTARAIDGGDIDALSAKIIEKQAASLVISYNADGNNARSEVRQVVHGIRRAARIELTATMTQDQNGRFARDTRNLSGDEFVEHEVAHHTDGLARKETDDIEQASEIHAGVPGTVGGGLYRAFQFRAGQTQSISLWIERKLAAEKYHSGIEGSNQRTGNLAERFRSTPA